MAPPFDTDVAIIGAGLAGLCAARELAMAGHRVMLADVKPRVGEGVHTTGIFVRRTLQDFALPEDCLGPAVNRVVIHSPGGRRLELESEYGEYRVGRMGDLYERLLAEAIQSGVEWYAGTRYRSCAPAGQGSAVWLERGGSNWRVRARLVIGADGAVSRVARHLGLDENHEWIVGVEEVLAGSVCEGAPEFHCYIDPALAPGYIGWVVDDGEETHIGVGGYAARFDARAALGGLRDRLNGELRLSALRRIERRGGRIPVNGIHRRIGNARGMLVGDAAGAVSPLTAGGLDPCLRLTQLAVRIASVYLDTGDRSVLEAYTGAPFRRHFIKRRLFRRMLGGVHHRVVAELIVMALRGPFRPVARRIFFGRGSFPDVSLIQRGFSAIRFEGVARSSEERPRRELPVGD